MLVQWILSIRPERGSQVTRRLRLLITYQWLHCQRYYHRISLPCYLAPNLCRLRIAHQRLMKQPRMYEEDKSGQMISGFASIPQPVWCSILRVRSWLVYSRGRYRLESYFLLSLYLLRLELISSRSLKRDLLFSHSPNHAVCEKVR